MNRKIIHSKIINVLNSITDQMRSESVEIHDGWRTGVMYNVGNVISYNGMLYRCLIAHTSQATWTPEDSPSLWAKIMYREGIRIIPDVIEATQAFAIDEKGWWGDVVYRSLMNANVFTPAAYPQGWEKQEV